jgi:hypothetical protein
MNTLKIRNKYKLSIIKQNNNINTNKAFSNKKILYCNNCGKYIQQNPVLCYMLIDYFCTKKCHIKKHKYILKKQTDNNKDNNNNHNNKQS